MRRPLVKQRRPTPDSQKPDFQTVLAQSTGGDASFQDKESDSPASDGRVSSMMDELFASFGNDAASQEALVFLKENSKFGGSAEHDFEELFETLTNKATWTNAVDQLTQNGDVSQSEANDLIRQIDQALKPLMRRESQIAVEFSRRIKNDGEENAVAWYKAESAKLKAAATGAKSSSTFETNDISPALASEVVNSKSRRLRGPPRRR